MSRESDRDTDDRLLSPAETATLLGLTQRWLEVKRYRGDGPPFVRISSRCVRYRRSDLEEWIDSRVRLSTADTGEAKA